MDDKSSPDSPNEKEMIGAPEPEKADLSGRRQSVALNIVENPLKVRLSSCTTTLHPR